MVVQKPTVMSLSKNGPLMITVGNLRWWRIPDGIMEYSTTPIDLVQFNTEAVVPFFASTKGYGILWDNNARSILNPPAFRRYPSKMAKMKPRVFLLSQLWMAIIYFTSTLAVIMDVV